jgi:hypothetical protein
VRAIDEHIEQLAHLHIVIRLEFELKRFFIELYKHMRALKIETIDDLALRNIDRIVKRLRFDFADDIKRRHKKAILCKDSG